MDYVKNYSQLKQVKTNTWKRFYFQQ
jgi:hypothetical protein